MSDIISEINQELRQDRGRMLLRKYGVYLVGVVIGIVVVVGGREAYIGYDAGRRAALADAYMVALAEESDGALRGLAEGDSDGYSMLSRFVLAGRLLERGEVEAAGAAYSALAADEGVDVLYRDAAVMMSVMSGGAEVSAADKIAALVPVAGRDGGLRPLALELMVGYAVEAGDFGTARGYYEQLRLVPGLSADLNRRLALLDEVLGED